MSLPRAVLRGKITAAVGTFHERPIVLTLRIDDGECEVQLTLTNPWPLKSLEALSANIDQIAVIDQNETGDSLEFGRYKVRLFVDGVLDDSLFCEDYRTTQRT